LASSESLKVRRGGFGGGGISAAETIIATRPADGYPTDREDPFAAAKPIDWSRHPVDSPLQGVPIPGSEEIPYPADLLTYRRALEPDPAASFTGSLIPAKTTPTYDPIYGAPQEPRTDFGLPTVLGEVGRGFLDMFAGKTVDPLTVVPAMAAPQVLGVATKAVPESSLGVFGSPQNVRGYHGTKHDVEKFKLHPSTVGTGEGNQSYGWGIYIADQKDVAETYRPEKKLTGMYNMVESPDQPGNLYRVEIDTEQKDLLDWFRPLSEQGVLMRDKVRKVYEQVGISEPVNMADNGRNIYKRLTEEMRRKTNDIRVPMGVSQQRASEALLESGIPGLKYFDQQSRWISPDDMAQQLKARKKSLEEMEQSQKESLELRDSLEGADKDAPFWLEESIAARKKNIKKLEDMIAEKKTQTYNYVVFDDSLLKIIPESSGMNKGGYVMTGAEAMMGLD
tara:strand:+ start:27 stop:1376 length:1350 start_codon:yes stop_codon:yes gene_type:complete